MTYREERGLGLSGYDWWKSETASEAFSISMAEIHEDSSSVPSYPAHLTRYCNLHLYCQSSLESRISEISYSGSLLMLTRGGGGWMRLGVVQGWRCEGWGGQIRGNQGVEG